MKSEVQEVLERVELAERLVSRLQRTAQCLTELPTGVEERSWLEVARTRLAERAERVRARLEEGLALPELKALRVERLVRLEQEWLNALMDLFSGLVREVGEGSPLVQALFPHQRFDKLERGGAPQRAFRAEFGVRRGSGYVRRLAATPDYAFLPALLERTDRANEALVAFETATDVDDAGAISLRDAIMRAGEALTQSLRQARALSEAALVDQPELLAELAPDERVRKRAPRPSAEQPAD